MNADKSLDFDLRPSACIRDFWFFMAARQVGDLPYL